MSIVLKYKLLEYFAPAVEQISSTHKREARQISVKFSRGRVFRVSNPNYRINPLTIIRVWTDHKLTCPHKVRIAMIYISTPN